MERFKFKFSAVLQVKKSKEEDALRLLSVAQRAYQIELQKKRFLIAELNKSLQRRDDLASAPNRSSLFNSENDYISGTKQKLIQADHTIMKASRGIEKALRTYLISKKQTRVIETLYDQAHFEYRKKRVKQEQKQLDDLMLMRARFKEGFES